MPERYLYAQDSFTVVSGSNYYTWSTILSQEIGKANNTLLKILLLQYINMTTTEFNRLLYKIIWNNRYPVSLSSCFLIFRRQTKSHFFKLLTAYLINLRQLSCALEATNSS